MIKEKNKKENKKQEQKPLDFLSELLEKHPEIKNEKNHRKRLQKLLLKYHPNKKTNLSNEEITVKLLELYKNL